MHIAYRDGCGKTQGQEGIPDIRNWSSESDRREEFRAG